MKKWIPVFIISFILFGFYYFHLSDYLNFESMRQHRQLLMQWTNEHYELAVCIYMLAYIVAVVTFLPGHIFVILAGGFLFGMWSGACYVVISATLGATLFFLMVKNTCAEWVEKKSGKWRKQLEQGFRENAFNYILTLRLLPLFPSWIVNITAALLGVRLITFASATFLGLIPIAMIYALIGDSLGAMFDSNQVPDFSIIFQDKLFYPIVGLVILSIFPILFKRFRRSTESANAFTKIN